jgi:alkylation response protein AidB-like acyl-CoA dehydrogenase
MTEEQLMLRDTAERYLRDNYDFNQRRARFHAGEFMSATHWNDMAEMGWLAMPLAEAHGGLGFGMQECAVIAEQFGRFLVVEPVLDSAVIAGSLLTHPGVRVDSAVAEGLATGKRIAVLADAEPDAAPSFTNTRSTLEQTVSGFRLKGTKVFAAGGGTATHFVITARLGDDFACVLVPRDTPGLVVDAYRTYDGRSAVNLAMDLELPPGALVAQGDLAVAAFARTRSRAMLMASAETLGAMSAALDATVDYTRQRVQFGQPLSSFQALQHRMSDMLIQTELTRSIVEAACRAHDQESEDAARLAAAAKVKATGAGRRITQEAIQLHGGIATTDEYMVGHYFKRVAALESWLVSREEALDNFIEVVDAA